MTTAQKRRAIGLGSALLALGLGYFALTRAIDHYLNSGALAEKIGKKTAVILKADAGYLPLYWRGLTVRSNGLLVRGKSGHGLTELRASDLRATCSLHELWQRKIVITHLQANNLQVAFGGAAAKNLQPVLAAEPLLQPQVEQPTPLNALWQ